MRVRRVAWPVFILYFRLTSHSRRVPLVTLAQESRGRRRTSLRMQQPELVVPQDALGTRLALLAQAHRL